MYAVLKKNRKIIHDYCVMLFLHFVQNMSTSRRNDCNNGEVGLAIDNLTSFIIDNFLALNSVSVLITRLEWLKKNQNQHNDFVCRENVLVPQEHRGSRVKLCSTCKCGHLSGAFHQTNFVERNACNFCANCSMATTKVMLFQVIST